MRNKKIITSLCVFLILALMCGIAIPIASASSVTLEALNPLGDVEPQYNQPLTSRDRFRNAEGEIDFNGKYIGISSYSKVGNAQGVAAIGELLKAEFPEVTIVNATNLGSPWNNKTDANYNQWAGVTTINVAGIGAVRLDAVIFGIGD